MKAEAPAHFLAIVLNGMLLIRQHIEVVGARQLSLAWHMIEPFACLMEDKAWSVEAASRIASQWYPNPVSINCTTVSLDELQDSYPDHTSVYKKGGGGF
jgi:hypothetical protein